jgi:hypothetical protein
MSVGVYLFIDHSLPPHSFRAVLIFLPYRSLNISQNVGLPVYELHFKLFLGHCLLNEVNELSSSLREGLNILGSYS